MNNALIENTKQNCIYDTTYLVPLTTLPCFTAISSCIIDHIIGSNSLSPNEKLYYLVNDFYNQSFKSWKLSTNKKSTGAYTSSQVKFSASKIGHLLGLSRSRIFNIQAKLESLDYLSIKRSINHFGMNNINVAEVTLPASVFADLIKLARNKTKSLALMLDHQDIAPNQRRNLLDQTKQFIPLNFDLFRFVFFNKNLSCNSKLLYTKLFSIIHKIKQKNHFPIYAGGIETNNLVNDCNISRSTLLRCLKQLKENGLISLEKIMTESKANASNRFDKVINYIQLLVPTELNHVFCKPISVVTDADIIENNNIDVVANNSSKTNDIGQTISVSTPTNEAIISSDSHASKGYPPCVKRGPSYTYNLTKKNINNNRSKKSNFIKVFLEEKEELKLTNEFVETKSKSCYFDKPKKLSEFYPLSSEDGSKLQSVSGRDFSLHAMNEILKYLSSKMSNHLFNSKKGFMSYMAKIYRYEMRDAVKISNETFKIRANQTDEDKIEKYLTEIENTRLVSQEWHLKKKLASVLNPNTAYNLLKNYQNLEINNDKVTIHLRTKIDLTDLEQDIILSQVKATHESLGDNATYQPITTIVFSIKSKTEASCQYTQKINNNTPNKKNQMSPKTGIWGNIRSKISELLGNDGNAIDVNWFSKLSAEIDNDIKQIKLKAPSEFFKREIEDRYQNEIQTSCKGIWF